MKSAAALALTVTIHSVVYQSVEYTLQALLRTKLEIENSLGLNEMKYAFLFRYHYLLIDHFLLFERIPRAKYSDNKASVRK